jgi:hypothetical protein
MHPPGARARTIAAFWRSSDAGKPGINCRFNSHDLRDRDGTVKTGRVYTSCNANTLNRSDSSGSSRHSQSLCKIIADSEGITHRYCDPD